MQSPVSVSVHHEKSRLTKFKGMFILCAIAFMFVVSSSMNGLKRTLSAKIVEEINQQSEEKSATSDRPIMYTFYNQIGSRVKHTGMTDDADLKLLQVWHNTWNDAGWDTRILSLEDAKKHPKFDEFKEKLNQVNLKGFNLVYNQLCFYRWLAMAAVGGGWMSDFDLLPMNIQNPESYFEDGSFAIYASTKGNGGGIPCLMSGSQSEWERMAFRVLDNALYEEKDSFISDMYSVIDIYHKDDQAYRLYNSVAGPLSVDWHIEACKNFLKALAVHFSHHSLHTMGVEDINKRAEVAEKWIEEWKEGCNVSSS